MSDFDMMMERRRSEQRKRRKKKDIDLINDNDDAIARLIADMRLAAREDNDLNIAKQPAVKKIGMLRNVMSQLTKVGYRSFYHCGPNPNHFQAFRI